MIPSTQWPQGHTYHWWAADSRRQDHVAVVTVGVLVVVLTVVLVLVVAVVMPVAVVVSLTMAQRSGHLFMVGCGIGLHQSHTGEHCLTAQQPSLHTQTQV